ncbi:MAG TPA: hypothetical protein VNI01_16480, partial [Elusimicrobiota bacterium]|nr:hypothetical protein [Elusimicrobiota bacterium]
IQAALRAKFGDNAVGMQLAFGRAETDDLPEGIVRGGRIFGLGYPGVWQPGTFHEVLEGLWLYSMHDIYHLVWGSRMPIWARQVPVRLYQLALDYLRWAASPAAGGEAPIVMPDQTQWDFATSAVVDMDWEIGVAGFAQFLTQWFGPLEQADGKVSLSALVLRDMGRHPGLWAGWGFDAQSAAALARELGPVGPELLESGRAASRKGL